MTRQQFEIAVSQLEGRLNRRIGILGVLAALLCSVPVIAIDFTRPLWYDEWVSRLLSRLHSPAVVWKALLSTADAQPPPFYLLTHLSLTLLGDSAFSLRLPQTLGFAVFCVCLFFFARRSVPPLYALGITLLPCASGAAYYASEGRPYGLELGTLGVILICWQQLREQGRRTIALVGLAVAIAAAICCHYYAVLFLLPLGVGELVRSFEQKRVDPAAWVAMLAGLSPLAIFRPLLRAAGQMSPHYWAPATFDRIAGSFASPVFTLAKPVGLLLLLCLAGGRSIHKSIREKRPPRAEIALAIALALLPLYMDLLSVYTHAVVPRYTIGMVGGVALLCGFTANRLRRDYMFPGIVFGLGMFGVVAFNQFYALRDARRTTPDDAVAVLRSTAPEALPLVVTNPHTFIPTAASRDGQLSHRVWFVADPVAAARARGFDTDDLNLLRLRAFVPINVASPGEFTTAHHSFLVVTNPEVPDWFLDQLRSQGARVEADASLPRLWKVTLPQAGAD